MKNNIDIDEEFSKKIKPKEIFNLFVVLIIILLVYFSINNRHKENQDIFAKDNKGKTVLDYATHKDVKPIIRDALK